mgnify:CR=1 FL=1
MPKHIGQTPRRGYTEIDDCAAWGMVRLTYKQQAMLPADQICVVLDTSDKGEAGRVAKRWWRWYATIEAVESCPRITPSMRDRVRGAKKEYGLLDLRY